MSLRELFPGLTDENHQITSPISNDYNCIAWAAGDDTVRWDPAPYYYWPRRVPRNARVDSLVQLFTRMGYSPCDDGELQQGIEKLAIFSIDGSAFTHIARQLDSGEWTSKIG